MDLPHRYRLTRRVSLFGGRTVAFCLLNPSTATEEINDPTVRRCIGFAETWGFATLRVVNLFAVRATDPREMFKMSAADVVGEENDCAILEAAAEADTFVAAWGNHGRHLDRDLAVMTLLHDVSVMCLGVTQKGMPAHPLYQRRDLEPARYGGREIPI